MRIISNFVRLFPAILSSILIVAHLSQADQQGLAIVCSMLPFLRLIRRRWVAKVLSPVIFCQHRMVSNHVENCPHQTGQRQSWTRLVIILGSVALFTALSTLVFESSSLKQRYRDSSKRENVSAITFLLTALLLSIVQIKVGRSHYFMGAILPNDGMNRNIFISPASADKLMSNRPEHNNK